MSDKAIRERGESLRRAVSFGLQSGKQNMIVELDLLDEIFRGNVPVGGNEKPPEDVNAMLYEVKRQRDVLISAIQKISRWCDGEDQPGQIVYEIERIISETRSHVLFREHPADAQAYADLAASGGIVGAP